MAGSQGPAFPLFRGKIAGVVPPAGPDLPPHRASIASQDVDRRLCWQCVPGHTLAGEEQDMNPLTASRYLGTGYVR